MAETLRRVLNRGSTAGTGENTAESGPPLLLLGAPGSGKTALLFAAALEAAGEGRGPVLFLTRRPLQSLPRGTAGALDPLRLQKIRFQYPPSMQELLRLLCSAHEAAGPVPSLLLLDGLEEYLAEDPGCQEAAYLAALLLDTAAHFGHRAGPSRQCGLVVALQAQEEADGGEVLQRALLQRYFPAQCWLQALEAGPGRRGFRVWLQPGELGPRAEWRMTFRPDGEMTITPWPHHTREPQL
ncbi:PREDICTED: ATPase SWSAP1 [Chinchilla lanigera]|uniref:SWIM-type zinc finger 7 associated protein 1 n=1 Tax=Chinchilla lanigera TaxID=34839 RepID=A0A8C2VNP8_CHILA|nr:PREDICTED: ATPase SWSAP1 [Chinchilla lanigera]